MTDHDQATIIKRVQGLCNELKHSEAIELTNKIIDPVIAVKAHLLCMEHEQRCRLDGKLPPHLV